MNYVVTIETTDEIHEFKKEFHSHNDWTLWLLGTRERGWYKENSQEGREYYPFHSIIKITAKPEQIWLMETIAEDIRTDDYVIVPEPIEGWSEWIKYVIVITMITGIVLYSIYC